MHIYIQKINKIQMIHKVQEIHKVHKTLTLESTYLPQCHK